MGIGERHAEEEGAEPDADRVDRRDEQLGARVVDDGDPAGAAGAVDGGPRLLREQPRRPAPDAAAVGEDAQQDEQGQHRAGRDVAERRADRERARQQQLAPAPGGTTPPATRKSSIWVSVRSSGPSMRYWRNWSIASTVRVCTDDHCRVICQTASHSRPDDDRERADHRDDDREPPGHAVAQHPAERGPQQRRDRGSRRAAGSTSSFSWMTSQMPTPMAAATTRNRHEYAVATRRPCGIDSDTSVETTRLRSRRASNSEPRGFSSEPLIPPV